MKRVNHVSVTTIPMLFYINIDLRVCVARAFLYKQHFLKAFVADGASEIKQ
jgi:hypothetical protein